MILNTRNNQLKTEKQRATAKSSYHKDKEFQGLFYLLCNMRTCATGITHFPTFPKQAQRLGLDEVGQSLKTNRSF
jgi:hypothetical protein